jgi:hypothetical protein
MLLAHVAAVEDVYRITTFEEREPSPEERAGWGAAVDLGPDAWRSIGGRPASHHIDRLGAVRARTLESFRAVDDAWLDAERDHANGAAFTRHWQWFHVCEDELSHGGQIRWLRARLPG